MRSPSSSVPARSRSSSCRRGFSARRASRSRRMGELTGGSLCHRSSLFVSPQDLQTIHGLSPSFITASSMSAHPDSNLGWPSQMRHSFISSATVGLLSDDAQNHNRRSILVIPRLFDGDERLKECFDPLHRPVRSGGLAAVGDGAGAFTQTRGDALGALGIGVNSALADFPTTAGTQVLPALRAIDHSLIH